MKYLQEVLELLAQIKAEYVNITANKIYGFSPVGYIYADISNDDFNLDSDICVSVNDLLCFIKNKDFSLTLKDNKLIAKSGKSKAQFGIQPIENLKIKDHIFSGELHVCKELIKAITLCDKNDQRFYLLGAGYSDKKIACSNGIALMFTDCNIVFKNIIPAYAIQVASKYDKPISFNEDCSFCKIQTGNISIVLGMIVGDFPAFERAIPQTVNHAVSVSAKELKAELLTAVQFSDKNQQIKLTFKDTTLFLETLSQGTKKFEAEIECSKVEEELVLGLKIDSLLKVISHSDEVDFKIEETTRPILIGENAVLTTIRL